MIAITVHCTVELLLIYCHYYLTIAYCHCHDDSQHVMTSLAVDIFIVIKLSACLIASLVSSTSLHLLVMRHSKHHVTVERGGWDGGRGGGGGEGV